MAVNTTSAEVKALIDTELTVEPFIVAATFLYNARVGVALPDDQGSVVLTWLAAHFVAVADPRETQESVGTGSWSFEGKASALASGLISTSYGQTALSLDTSGKLRDNDKRKARFRVL